jgi:hypothetical protein
MLQGPVKILAVNIQANPPTLIMRQSLKTFR